MKVAQIVEAVLFASDAPLKAEEIARADESLDEDMVEAALRELSDHYAESDRSFQIAEVADILLGRVKRTTVERIISAAERVEKRTVDWWQNAKVKRVTVQPQKKFPRLL